MATTKKNESLAEKSRQRYAAAKEKADAIFGEEAKVRAALEEIAWQPGESALPLIDLERQRDMLSAQARTAEKALTRAEQNLWPTDQPDVAIAVAALLDGVFLDGAPATAYEADPGTPAERPEFRVIQDKPHRIDSTGAVIGDVRIILTGPDWAQSMINASDKLTIIDTLHHAGVRYLNESESRVLRNRWRESLTVEVAVQMPKPYISPGAPPSGRIDASVVGGWNWRRETAVGVARVERGSMAMPSYIPKILEAGRPFITVVSSSLDGNVRTTELEIAISVSEDQNRGNEDVAEAAMRAMACRAVVPGIGRVQSVGEVTTKGWQREIDATKVARGFTVTAKVTAVGTVR